MKSITMKLIKVYLLFFLLLSAVFSVSAQSNSLLPLNLRCDFWENPKGIDFENPALSWNIKSPKRAINQTAYQVLVATTATGLQTNNGDMWNSGKVLSNQMGQIKYLGKSLVSSRQYWWKVRVWDEEGKVSLWSEPAEWTMGILNQNEWKAKWITAAGAEKYAPVYQSNHHDFFFKKEIAEVRAKSPKPGDTNYSSLLLRKDFVSRPKLLRAIVHVSGLGQYELTVNGKKAGDVLLSPGWSDYKKTVLYDTYDVTQLITPGKNAIGLMLSNGMYNIQPDTIRYVKVLNTYGPLKAIVHLRLSYSDGSVQTIGTDNTWQVSPGPVTYMNEYGGEDFDARLVQQGWNKSSFKVKSSWNNALECAGPGGKLKGLSCAAPPLKAIETLTPVKITQLKPNVYIYDLGQNASVMPEISVKGKIGSFVRIIPAELLKPNGMVDRSTVTQWDVLPAWWQYTKATDGIEKWFPKFFYQGGRYLQVELFPAKGDTVLPVLEHLTGVVVHTSAKPIGDFSCSNDLFNRIYTLIRWAQRSNLMSTLTDCPHREKMGWLEQYHLNGPALRYNFDLLSLYRKGMNDMSDSQLDNGFVPNIAPEFFMAGGAELTNGFRNSPEWGSSFIIVPWQQYLFSGDVSLLNRYYDQMKHYVSFLSSISKDNIVDVGLGDWYDIGPKGPGKSQLTPIAFTATAIYFYDTQIMAQVANLLGKADDAKSFAQKAQAIRQSFNKEFYKPEKGIYATGSNTALAMSLFMNIAEPENRKTITDSLVNSIRKAGNSFTAGDVGYRFLLKALAMEGHSNLIYDMNNQSDKPGYGYQLKKGATSLTEKWNADGGTWGSQNHFMLGQINEWFFNDLVGIGVDADGAGFRKSIIKPEPVGDLKWVKGSYQTVSGLISVDWKKEDGVFSLDVSIPANTSATVFVPADNANQVNESGKPAGNANGVKFIKFENGKAIYEVASGEYHFVVK